MYAIRSYYDINTFFIESLVERDYFTGFALLGRPASDPVRGNVGRYAIDPRGKLRVSLEVRKTFVDSQEDLLRQVLRLALSDKSCQVPEDPRVE